MRQSIQVDHIPFKFLKGCLPQTLLGPLLNTLSHIKLFSPLDTGRILNVHMTSMTSSYRFIFVLIVSRVQGVCPTLLTF